MSEVGPSSAATPSFSEERTMQKLLQTSVKFQGIEMKLLNILSESSKAIEAIPLNELVIKKQIEIGNVLEKVKIVKIHVDRK